MGHERVGKLPKSKKWQSIVGQIAASSGADIDVSGIAAQTLQNVRHRFRDLQDDEATRAAFTFLVFLAVSSGQPDTLQQIARQVNASADTLTPLKAVKALRNALSDVDGSPEYQSIVISAASDALVLWYEQNKPTQQRLFDSFDTTYDIWHKASDGAGFCDLARLFFGKVAERYLNYFLEREASQVAPTLEARNAFREQLESHVDEITRHAFETSKITQSYAAGWFNRYATNDIPTISQIDGFISYSFGKLRDELMREGRSN